QTCALPISTILALPASLGGGASSNAAAPSAPAPAPAPDASHPTMAPPATVPPVSQPPRTDDASASNGGSGTNAAYLAALGLMSGDGGSAAPTTGPQPVPLPSDGGPLGTAPSTARALDLAPDGHGDFGAPVHRA